MSGLFPTTVQAPKGASLYELKGDPTKTPDGYGGLPPRTEVNVDQIHLVGGKPEKMKVFKGKVTGDSLPLMLYPGEYCCTIKARDEHGSYLCHYNMQWTHGLDQKSLRVLQRMAPGRKNFRKLFTSGGGKFVCRITEDCPVDNLTSDVAAVIHEYEHQGRDIVAEIKAKDPKDSEPQKKKAS